MDWQRTNNLDPALLPFLTAADEAVAERQLCQIISEFSPTIKAIVRSKLRVSLDPKEGTNENQDALEVVSEVDTLLVEELRRLKSGTGIKPIADFHGYVAVVTYHACYQHLRRKYPERWRLKNRLRYLLTHRPTLTLWKNDEGQLLCDFAARDQARMLSPSTPSQQLPEGLPESLLAKLSTKDPQPGPLTELLVRILERADGPVALDDLVNIVTDVCDIESHAARAEKIEDVLERQSVRLADPQVDLATALEQRIHLEQLWLEIRQLPLRHRAAILLNLRDAQGRGVITLFPLTRVATIRQIAEALEFSLEDFASVWKELPWDDTTIAQHLGLTRQQVINLRHSARARLARRVKGY
jgi:hypothetical protein